MYKLLPWVVAFMAIIFFSACKPETVTEVKDPNLSITYPALFVANSEDNTLSVIDLTTQTVRDKITLQKGAYPYHLSLSPDKSKMAVSMTDKAPDSNGNEYYILIIDTKTGNQLHYMRIDNLAYNALWSSDGKTLWFGQNQGGQVCAFEGEGGYNFIKTIASGNKVAEVTFSPDRSKLFAANSSDGTVTVLDPETKEITKTIPVGTKPNGAWPGANGKMYACNEGSKTLSVINLGSLEVEKTVELGFSPSFATFNVPDFTLWVCNPGNGEMVAFQEDGLDWVEKGRTPTGAGAHSIVSSTNGHSFISNATAGTVSVLNSGTREKIKDITVGKSPTGMAVKE